MQRQECESIVYQPGGGRRFYLMGGETGWDCSEMCDDRIDLVSGREKKWEFVIGGDDGDDVVITAIKVDTHLPVPLRINDVSDFT